jgi:YbbR domain-containing protein
MRSFIKNLFLRNWGLNLISLILAFVLWLTFIPEEKTFSEKTLTISLETYNIPRMMELVEKPPAAIDVTIRAPNRLISQISSANVYAKLDLERASIFQQEYTLNIAMISIPAVAEVIRISPNIVNLKLERTEEIMMDVVPSIIGELKEGLKIQKMEIIPPSVPVKGPESKIKKKEKVRTSPIDISSLTQSTELEADLILPRPDLRLASSQTTVKIKILISEEKPPEGPANKTKKRTAPVSL